MHSLRGDGNFEASPAQPILGVVKFMPRSTSTYGLEIYRVALVSFASSEMIEHLVRQI